jgi:hypothetical protein
MKNSGDNTSSGLYYQWGRKDPFYIDINGVSQFVTDTTKNLYINYLDSAIQHPNTFYAVPTTSTNYDWIGSGQNNNMWSTVDGRKGPFDPCPFGWRLPVVKDDFSGSPWYGITGNTAARANGAVYPLAGYLDAFSGERYEETGSSGVVSGGVWSASARALQATVFKYTGSAAGTEATWRANGYPVRCVKDTR